MPLALVKANDVQGGCFSREKNDKTGKNNLTWIATTTLSCLKQTMLLDRKGEGKNYRAYRHKLHRRKLENYTKKVVQKRDQQTVPCPAQVQSQLAKIQHAAIATFAESVSITVPFWNSESQPDGKVQKTAQFCFSHLSGCSRRKR